MKKLTLTLTQEAVEWMKELLEDMDPESLTNKKVKSIIRSWQKEIGKALDENPA